MTAGRVSTRRAVPGDEQSLSLLGAATFLEAFVGVLPGRDIALHCERQHAATVYRAWLDDPHTAVWLATVEPGEGPVGYLVLTKPDLPLPDVSPEDLEVKRVYLLPRCQGQGVGRRLLGLAAEWGRSRQARRLLLGVYAKNAAALAFYTKTGFRPVGERTFRVGEHDYHDLILAREV